MSLSQSTHELLMKRRQSSMPDVGRGFLKLQGLTVPQQASSSTNALVNDLPVIGTSTTREEPIINSQPPKESMYKESKGRQRRSQVDGDFATDDSMTGTVQTSIKPIFTLDQIKENDFVSISNAHSGANESSLRSYTDVNQSSLLDTEVNQSTFLAYEDISQCDIRPRKNSSCSGSSQSDSCLSRATPSEVVFKSTADIPLLNATNGDAINSNAVYFSEIISLEKYLQPKGATYVSQLDKTIHNNSYELCYYDLEAKVIRAQNNKDNLQSQNNGLVFNEDNTRIEDAKKSRFCLPSSSDSAFGSSDDLDRMLASPDMARVASEVIRRKLSESDDEMSHNSSIEPDYQSSREFSPLPEVHLKRRDTDNTGIYIVYYTLLDIFNKYILFFKRRISQHYARKLH